MNITRGITYRFRYRAANVNGWSGWSPIAYIQAATVPRAPLAPTLVTSDSSSLTLQINPSLDNGGSPIIAYKLFMDNGTLGSDFTLVDTFTDAYVTYTLDSINDPIESGGKYRFIAVATNSIGDSEASDEVRFTVSNLP